MRHKIFDFNVATEDNNSSKTAETEIAIYCKINNFEGLKEAVSSEEQHQVEGTYHNGIRCRVRKTTKDGNSTNSYTFKVPVKDNENYIAANNEYSVEVDDEFFEGFRANVAEKAVKKTRYIFESKQATLSLLVKGEPNTVEIPKLIYEVDVYVDKDHNPIEWCKIDIEVDELTKHVFERFPGIKDINLKLKISHLPFQPSNPILTFDMTEADKQFINLLWESHYNQTP